MTLILTGVVLIAFLTGLAMGMCRGHESRECLRIACRKLVDENCKLRAADETTRLYRPVSNVEPVEPDESDHIVAEWLSMYDPRYHTET